MTEPDRAKGGSVFPFTVQLMRAAEATGSKEGIHGFHRQVVDLSEEDPAVRVPASIVAPCTFRAEYHGGFGEAQLDYTASRQWLADQLAHPGFTGLAGFFCFEATGDRTGRVVAEAVDAAVDRSIAMSMSVSKSFLGKWRRTSDPTLHGEVDPLPPPSGR